MPIEFIMNYIDLYLKYCGGCAICGDIVEITGRY